MITEHFIKFLNKKIKRSKVK